MGVHNIADHESFKTSVTSDKSGELIVLDMFATWCGPCKTIAPVVAKYSEDYPEAKFYKIDVDENPTVAQELGVRAMPTFLLFKNGEKVGEIIGADPRKLKQTIEQNL